MIFGPDLSIETAVWLAVLIPFVSSIVIWALRDMPNVRESATILTAIVTLGMVLHILGPVDAGARPTVTLWEMFPGLSLTFTVEPMGVLFATIASALWIVTSFYSIGYMRAHHEKNQTRFHTFFKLAIASAIGVAFSGNLLTLFFFYEILTLSTFPLVAHHETEEAKKGGRVYLGVLLTTSILFQLPAIIWVLSLTGTLDFRPGGILAGTASPILLGILLVLFLFGIGKAALMPFHRWLPAAMVAPTPVSALLHAVAVVKAGVFTVVKVAVFVFGVDLLKDLRATEIMLWVAGFTILAASVVALRQDNLKRRLAYSTVSQLGYVVMAALILAPLSTVGAALHILAHAVGKITLFFCAGAILVAAHKTEVSELKGLGRKMPITFAAFGIASLSIIGIPPTIGFLSKWYILQGAMEVANYFAVAVLFISTALNAVYLLPVVYDGFLRGPKGQKGHGGTGIKEAPLLSLGALSFTAAATVILFFFPGWALSLVQTLTGTGG